MNRTGRIPELLSPAGDLDKLNVVYQYGADAAYIGIYPFSLRKKSYELQGGEMSAKLRACKPDGKKLYGAVNMIFTESDIDILKSSVEYLSSLPLDAVIISDMGAAGIIRKRLPSMPLHLSTQASCLNSESVKVYSSLGFSRIILGRECTLDDVRRIKDSNPDIEIEVFVHGAMCMAVSGRCFLSAAMNGRSANKGECSHSCRWNYRLAIEEQERPGKYMPVSENDGWSSILSSRDLCMIEHLDELVDTGVDSLKIEGRMKSVYYASTVTRAYRKALDRAPDAPLYIDELMNVSHREYTTGFFFGEERTSFRPPAEEYTRNYRFLGIVGDRVRDNIYEVDIRYQICSGREIEYIGPDVFMIADDNYRTIDENFRPTEHIDHNRTGYLQTDRPVKKGYIIREMI